MKRVGRIIYRLLSGLSILLLLATAGIWVRSYWVSDRLDWEGWSRNRTLVHQITVRCSRGGLQFVSSDCESFPLNPSDLPHFERESEAAVRYPTFAASVRLATLGECRINGTAGFEIARTSNWGLWEDGDPFIRASSVTLPLWFLMLLFGMVPAHFLVRFGRGRIARRRGRGCCAECGYDLRAAPGRCPECGTIMRAD